MKIEISRDEMIQVLLATIAEMDPEEARDELYEHYAQNVYPQYTEEQLAADFYEKIIHFELAEESEEHRDAAH